MLSRKLLARRRSIGLVLFWKLWKAGGENDGQMPDHSCLDHPERVLSHYWNGVNVAHAAHYFLATIRKGPLVQDGKFCTRGFVF